MKQEIVIETGILNTPVGYVVVKAGPRAIHSIDLVRNRPALESIKRASPHMKQALKEIKEYFQGKRTSFSFPKKGLGTTFQQKVWAALEGIPFGRAVTYSDIAKKIGKPKAMRAVGLACKNNPIGIVVPCHRVIGKSGKLIGFNGGIEKKRWLLHHEARALVRASHRLETA